MNSRIYLAMLSPLLFFSCSCPEKEPKPTPITKCFEGKSAIAGCVRVQMKTDLTASCEKPTSETKAQGWFLAINAQTPVQTADTDRYDFRLKAQIEVSDSTGKVIKTTEIDLRQPSKKEWEAKKNLISCRYASKSDAGSFPQWIAVKPTCIGRGDACDLTALGEVVERAEKDAGPN